MYFLYTSRYDCVWSWVDYILGCNSACAMFFFSLFALLSVDSFRIHRISTFWVDGFCILPVNGRWCYVHNTLVTHTFFYCRCSWTLLTLVRLPCVCVPCITNNIELYAYAMQWNTIIYRKNPLKIKYYGLELFAQFCICSFETASNIVSWHLHGKFACLKEIVLYEVFATNEIRNAYKTPSVKRNLYKCFLLNHFVWICFNASKFYPKRVPLVSL